MNTKYLDIIKAPVITEKSNIAVSEGKYTFKVDPKANKTEIKLAIEKIFKVKVESISTINVIPKKKRVG
ncbi:MAG: 50S ribosomal protein L23, partial [Bacilli bacterium]